MKNLYTIVLTCLIFISCSQNEDAPAKVPVVQVHGTDPATALVSAYNVLMETEGQSRLTSLGERSATGGVGWKGVLRIVESEPAGLSLLEFVEHGSGSLNIEGETISQVTVDRMPPVPFFRGDDGTVTRLLFEESHDVYVQNIVQPLLAHGLPSCKKPIGGSWRSKGADLQGVFVARSQVDKIPSISDGSFEYRRELIRYESLEGLRGSISDIEQLADGGFNVRCDADGGLESLKGQLVYSAIKGSMELHGYTLSLHVERLETEHRPFSDEENQVLEGVIVVSPESWGFPLGQLQDSERLRRALLESKREGIEVPQVIGYAATFDILGKQAEHNRTFKRAVALLQLQDEVAREIADAALEPQSGPKALAFLMDVLAGAETVAAQDELLRILHSDKVRNAHELVQAGALTRLGFIVHPTEAVVRHAVSAYKTHGQEETTLGDVSALTLGSVVRHLEPQLAAEGVELLLAGLEAAQSPQVIRSQLLGLANSQAIVALNPIIERVRHVDSFVRGATATALRSFPLEETEVHLLRLVGDEGSAVQASALRALADVLPSSAGCEAILSAVAKDRVRSINLILAQDAITSCSSQVRDGFFGALRNRKGLEPALSQRLRAWLKKKESK